MFTISGPLQQFNTAIFGTWDVSFLLFVLSTSCHPVVLPARLFTVFFSSHKINDGLEQTAVMWAVQ